MRSRHPSRPFTTLAGSLLLAHPGLKDANFARTVVLLSVHDSDGAMGLVLNRPTGRRLAEIDGVFALGGLASVPVYAGGPVQTQQMILCAWRIEPEGPGGFQLHFGLEPTKAEALLSEPGMEVRAFLGYAGWSEGQLEGEVDAEAWAVTTIPENVMELEAGGDWWRGVLDEINHEWRLWADEPSDPSAN